MYSFDCCTTLFTVAVLRNGYRASVIIDSTSSGRFIDYKLVWKFKLKMKPSVKYHISHRCLLKSYVM